MNKQNLAGRPTHTNRNGSSRSSSSSSNTRLVLN